LISGTPDIDIDEWRAATEYNGYTSSDPVIVWWWRALKSFNRDERAKVLSFATGAWEAFAMDITNELNVMQGRHVFRWADLWSCRWVSLAAQLGKCVWTHV
jgi:E3 ubiquitin-protein ligase HUWE1